MGEPIRDHYIVLPSNVDHLAGEQENTPNHFKTPLARPLELPHHEWEVALSEINYPHSWSKSLSSKHLWYSFRKAAIIPTLQAKIEDTKIHYQGFLSPGEINKKIEELKKLKFAEKWTWRSVKETISKSPIRKRELNTPAQVIFHLIAIRPDEFKGRFSYQSKNKQVSVNLKTGESIYFNPALRTLLGFNQKHEIRYDDGEVTNPNEDDITKQVYKVLANNRPDFHESKYNLFVYCNLVTNTVVGDTEVPLLRTIPVDTVWEHVVYHHNCSVILHHLQAQLYNKNVYQYV